MCQKIYFINNLILIKNKFKKILFKPFFFIKITRKKIDNKKRLNKNNYLAVVNIIKHKLNKGYFYFFKSSTLMREMDSQ